MISENIAVKAPEFKRLTQEVLDNVNPLNGKYLLCRLVPYKMNEAGLDYEYAADNKLKLPIIDEYFLIDVLGQTVPEVVVEEKPGLTVEEIIEMGEKSVELNDIADKIKKDKPSDLDFIPTDVVLELDPNWAGGTAGGPTIDPDQGGGTPYGQNTPENFANTPGGMAAEPGSVNIKDQTGMNETEQMGNFGNKGYDSPI
jgi:hypothetical protein